MKFGYLIAFLMPFIWGGWIIISTLGVNSNLNPMDIILIRFIFAGIFLPFFIGLAAFKKIKRIFELKILFISLVYGLAYLIFSLIAMHYSSAIATGIGITGTLPIFSLLLLVIWQKEKVRLQAFFGVLLVITANFLMLNEGRLSALTLLLFLSAAFCFSLYSVAVKVWKLDIKTLLLANTYINLLFSAVIWLLMIIFFQPSGIAQEPLSKVIFQGLYQGIIVSIIAAFVVTYCSQTIGSTNLGMIVALTPSVVTLLSVLFFNEILQFKDLLALLTCFIGVIIYHLPKINKKRQQL